MKKFLASTIKCYEEDCVLTVALGDDSKDPESFIIISRLDDEDNSCIEEGIGLQTDQSEYEMPNSIKEVILSSESLEVIVKSEFVDFFGDASIFAEIPRGSHNADKISELKKTLQQVFSGTTVKLLINT